MKIQELLDYLEARVPLRQQEDFDNSGVQCGDTSLELSGVLIAIDITEAVIDEAIEKGCNLIVAHHPALFRATKTITPSYYIHRCVMKAIKYDIVLYAAHTSLDNDDDGVNVYWARQMGLSDIEILEPHPDNPLVGGGVIGNLPQPVTITELLALMKRFQPITHVTHSKVLREKVQRIAYCGGSGNFMLRRAARSGADIFITGEAKYNDFYDAQELVTLMTIGHFESELLTKEILMDIMSEKRGNFAVYNATTCVNPVHYI